VAAGTPEEVAAVEESHTGQYLRSRVAGKEMKSARKVGQKRRRQGMATFALRPGS